jgi:hypothetical protein
LQSELLLIGIDGQLARHTAHRGVRTARL